MASPEKLKQYIKETEIAKNYAILVQGMLGKFAENYLAQGEDESAEIVQLHALIQDQMMNLIVEAVSEYWGSVFNDDELDELLRIHHSPVCKKMRENIPGLQNHMIEVLNKMDMDSLVERTIDLKKAQDSGLRN
jgi:hypothetical protein